MSRADIARELGVGFSTVARWFREDGHVRPPGVSRLEAWRTAHQRTIAQRRACQQAEQDGHRDAVGVLADRELFLTGVALYWAEGAKSKAWRREQRVQFVNGDASMIRVFLAWLDLVGVPRQRLSCRLQIHDTADVAKAEEFWKGVVGPGPAWAPTTLKRHRIRTERRNTGEDYVGCLVIYVADGSSLYRRVAGAWEGIVAAVASAQRSPVV